MSLKTPAVAPLLAVLLLAGGCSVFAPEPLVITASAEQTLAAVTAPVAVTVTVTNQGDRRVEFGRGSTTCQLSLQVRVGRAEYLAPIIDRVCTMDLATQALGPGASRTETLYWNGHITRRADTVERLEPGTYEIRGLAGDRVRSAPVVVTLLADSP